MIRETIIQEIKRQGISRKQLHRESGVLWATLSRYLSGKAGIMDHNLEKILHVLKLKLKPKTNSHE